MAFSAPHRLEEVYSMSIQLALRFDEAPITCETRAALSKALLERYPLWRYPDFQRLIQYQAPRAPGRVATG
jgi:hypothetical protein